MSDRVAWRCLCPICGWPEALHVPILACPRRMMRLANHFALVGADDE